MSYSKKQLVRLPFPEHDFGAGDEIYSVRVPLNEHGGAQQAEIVNVGVSVTETFANTAGTTVTSLEIGTAADNDAYAKLVIPDATADEDCFDVSDDTDAILSSSIASGTLIEINCKQGTATAGKGMPFVEMYCW